MFICSEPLCTSPKAERLHKPFLSQGFTLISSSLERFLLFRRISRRTSQSCLHRPHSAWPYSVLLGVCSHPVGKGSNELVKGGQVAMLFSMSAKRGTIVNQYQYDQFPVYRLNERACRAGSCGCESEVVSFSLRAMTKDKGPKQNDS
jgi:hypothetical protein